MTVGRLESLDFSMVEGSEVGSKRENLVLLWPLPVCEGSEMGSMLANTDCCDIFEDGRFQRWGRSSTTSVFCDSVGDLGLGGGFDMLVHF